MCVRVNRQVQADRDFYIDLRHEPICPNELILKHPFHHLRLVLVSVIKPA